MKSFRLLLLLLLQSLGCALPDGQKDIQIESVFTESVEPLQYHQITSDTIFNSSQNVHILQLRKRATPQYQMVFGHSDISLTTTSSLAKHQNAVAGINGGFFNMDVGGSVAYFEVDDSVISKTYSAAVKWGISDSIRNGAIILSDDQILEIESAKPDTFYASSRAESAVLTTGPVLILSGKKEPLPKIKFSTQRHPRTCLCERPESYLLIAIDGRQEEADGMTLHEVQDFLLTLGCNDAINLDGGGSTTMWTREKGVINSPRDKSGERPVSNALLILDSTQTSNQ